MPGLSLRRGLLALLVSLAPLTAHADEIIVSAAASLNNAFKDAAAGFEKKYPDHKVMFNFAASGTLLQQIDKGAPVDVFASADQKTMNLAVEKGLIDETARQDFAVNSLVLIVPASSSLTISGLADLAGVKRIAIGNPDSVPAGRYAKESLEKADLWEKLKEQYIYTQNVRQALDYVVRDEVDIGFVYGSDANLVKDKVKNVLEVSLEKPVTYPIAPVKKSEHAEAARLFVDYILSDEGQKILSDYGFSAVKGK